jgi:hypothetical protein
VFGDFGKALLGADVEEVPPTGRTIDPPAVFVHEIRDDLIVARTPALGTARVPRADRRPRRLRSA